MSSASELLRDENVVEWVPSDAPDLVHIAVAFAGRLLTDLGARVIRVVPEPDPLTRLRSFAPNSGQQDGVLERYLNRGKVTVHSPNLGPELDAAAIVLAGAPELEADIRSGANKNSSIVTATAFRPGSDLEGVPVSELGIQGLVGLTDLFGEPGEQPLMLGGHQTGYAMGYAIFCAAMAAIAKLRLRGQTDDVAVNAVDALAWVNWKGIAAGTLGFPIQRGGRAAEAPVLRCADGYFAFLYMPQNWPDICEAVADPRLDDDRFAKPRGRAKHAADLNEILAEWMRDKTRAELYAFCQRCAIPGGPVLHGADLLEDPLYAHRQYLEPVPHESHTMLVPGLPMTIEGTAPTTATPNQPPTDWTIPEAADLPLAGMLVLDLGIFTAGSVTSTLLADLGARVIKVESQSYSDPFRLWPGVDGDSPLFTFNNRNKLGVNINLKSDAGRETFLALVAQADVVVENFRRGVLDRLGIGFDALKQANPRIVLASISGQGASGPGSSHVSFGSTLEAIGGISALTGYEDGPCYISGRNLNYPDQIVCLYGAGAAIAAVLRARQAGTGMHIDVSQREVTTLAVGERVAAASILGDDARKQPDRFPGNGSFDAALQDILATNDGWLCITAPDDAAAAKVADLLECDVGDLWQRLRDWLATQDTESACRKLRTAGVAAFAANTGSQAAQEPTILTGTAFARTAADAMVKGFPFQFVATPMRIYAESPRMGEHTDEVLGKAGLAEVPRDASA